MNLTLAYLTFVECLLCFWLLRAVQGSTCDWQKTASCTELPNRNDGRKGWENENVCLQAPKNTPDTCRCVTSQCHRKPPDPKCPAEDATDHCKRRVCYWPNWAQYKDSRIGKNSLCADGDSPDLPHYAQDIPACLCTHIVYAFLGINNGVITEKEWNDLPQGYQPGQLHCFKKYIKRKTSAKALVALGGWTENNWKFHKIVADEQSRSKFIKSLITFLRKHEFDGIDYDWEYPDLRCQLNAENPETLTGGDCSLIGDKDRFTTLLKETMAAFEEEATTSGKPRLMVTLAVGCGDTVIPQAYDVAQIHKHVDYISLMSYDLKGAWDGITGHNAALYGDFPEDKKNVKWCASEFHKLGAPKMKLNIGIAFYGRSFTINKETAENDGIGLNITGTIGGMLPYSEGAGTLFYYEACELLKKAGAQEHWLEKQQASYLTVKNDDGSVYWAGYDNVKSVENKVEWTRREGYGGVMVWDVTQDDFLGIFCDQGPAPLLHALNKKCFDDLITVSKPQTTHTVDDATTDSKQRSANNPEAKDEESLSASSTKLYSGTILMNVSVLLSSLAWLKS